MNAPAARSRPDWQPFLLALLVTLIILTLCGSGILYVLNEKQDQEGARLQAIVDLQTRQIADWLRERQDDAEMVRLSPALLEESRRWLDQGDLAAAQQTQARLARLTVKRGIGAVYLHDPDGRPVWGTENMPQHLAPELARALAASATTNRIQRIGPYLDDLGQIHLDHVVRLADAGRSPLVVLHSDAEDWLCPTLRAWPILSDSGETFLFRRDGDQVLYLCPLRHLSDAVLRLRLPVSSEHLLAAQWLRGEVGAGDLIKGVDYRGVPVLGVAEAIPGTDWFMIAKLDQAEIRALAVPKILLIGLVGGLMLVIFFAGSLLLRHRQQLALATATHAAQSERLDALERLHASERRFLATFEQAAVGIALVAPDGRWLRINRRFYELLGYAETELLDKTFQDITHPEDLGRDLELVGRLLAGEIETYALDKRYIRQDASLAWVHLTVALVRQDDGAPDYFISVIEDISARKAAESRLALWNDAFEKAELNLALGDAIRQRLLAVNPAFAKRRGYLPDEMTGMPVASLFPADRLDEILSELREADTKGHHVFETEHLCKDGERFPVLLDVTVTYADDGRPATLIVYALDISARLAAVAARRESEARLREAQRIAGLGHWEWDMRTDRHTWSEEIYRFYGRDPALPPARYPEVAGYFTPESWAGLTQAVETALSEGKAYQCDAEVVRPDGSHRWITARGEAVRDAAGQVILLRGTVQDVTVRKETEKTLRENEERFRSVFDQQFQFMAILTPEGRVIDINELVLRFQGYAREDFIGRLFWDSPAWRDYPEWQRIWQERLTQAAASEGPILTQDVYQMRDGQVRMADAATSAIREPDGAVRWYVIQATDTTERRLAETALHESEERLRLFFEHASITLAMFDREMRYLAVSRRWLEEFGLRDRDILGQCHYRVFSEIIPDHWKAAHARGLAGEVVTADEDFIEHADGSQQWLRWEVRPWHAVDGQVGGIVIFSEDITARKEAELALRASRQRFQDIVDASADWVWEVDPQGRYTYVSDGVLNVLGYPPEEILGRSPFDLMPPEEAERVAAAFDDIVTRRATFRDLENMNRHRDGHLLHIHTTGMPILNATGELLGYRGLDRDVTDRRQAEIALRDSRELLRTLVRSIPDLVWLKDPQGMFMICNARFEDLLGAPEAQVIGKTDYDFAPRTLADTFRANDLDAIAADGPWLNEEELTFASDGHRELVQVIKTPVYDTTGALIGVLGIGRDITRIKRTEDELERHRHHLEELVVERTTELMAARTEAERLARAKSEFLANMSHEIRTPMNAVLGLAYLLERQDLNAEARELARKIHHSGRSLLGIINDILDFSRIESNRIEIERAPLRLDEVLDNLATIMTASAADRSLELVIRPPDCLDCTLLGDALRLGQILINLTGNAIKFTDRGVVEVRIDILQRIESSISLRFAIRDTGIGIDADAQARLFQPFAQADASTTRRFGGSGLGLAISRRLVELMGGRLELDSTPGEGSTFWFDLTFDVLDTGPRRRDDLARIRVLIVDEHAVVREGAAATVAALGWTSTQIASGRQALGHVLRDRSLQGPDAVVLLDWREPGPDVLGIANAIRHTLPASSQPLLFLLAAHNSMALLETPNMQVVDAVLTQPLTPSTFHDAVVRERRRRLGGLPLDQATMASERRLAGLRLLVVDDSDINREVAQSIFADEGAEIHLARDGREAVDWLCAHPAAVDMVLMDVQMPVMDGRAATRLIRQIPEIAALPIVALTADALRDQEAAALESGMDAFLSKPFDVAEAVTLIRTLARRPADVHATDRTQPPGTHHAHRERPAVPVVSAPVPADLIHNERDPARQHHPRDDQGAELPGIDLNQGLKIWKDPNVYRRYLRRFADSYADSVQVIAAAEPDAARQFAHKLKGTAGNLGLPEVAALAGALEKQFASGLPVSVEPLREALDRALDSIARYAPDVIAVIPADARPATSLNLPQVQIASLLRDALSAFERFDPADAAPALEALAAYLPAVQLVPLRQAITEFDVTAGTAAVHDLAGRLAIQMEN